MHINNENVNTGWTSHVLVLQWYTDQKYYLPIKVYATTREENKIKENQLWADTQPQSNFSFENVNSLDLIYYCIA